MARLPDSRTLARLHRQASTAPDALTRLDAAYRSIAAFETWLERAVRLARRQGYTWDEIGDVLGITKQAARKRFGGDGRRNR